MPQANKKHRRQRPPIVPVFAGLIALGLVLYRLLIGTNIALLNPKGQIAQEQHKLMMFTLVVLLFIAIPTLTIFYFIAWKYRATNPKVTSKTEVKYSKSFVALLWLIPTSIVVILAITMWPATHRLAPQKSFASDVKPLTVQVVSLRWKWLFLYPEQGIATVNFVQLPINTPVTFEMTADEAPMSSFWIPNLGGQLYTMTSHVNRLNLMADTMGDYPGSTPEINGNGFAGMKFNTRVSSADDFKNWVKDVRQSPDLLDTVAYQKLLAPSENNPTAYYSSYQSDLYGKVISKYTGTTEGKTGSQ